MLLLFCICSNNYGSEDRYCNQPVYPNLLRYVYAKNKINNPVGWVLVGSGVALMGIGALTDYNEHVNSTYNGMGEPLFYAGLTVSLISIPFFITARQNKNKAKLALKNKAVFVGKKILSKSDYTALT